MKNPSVTYTGEEVALVAGCIAASLPYLAASDFDVADLLLDKALAAMPQPLSPDLEVRIALLRSGPRPQPMESTR